MSSHKKIKTQILTWVKDVENFKKKNQNCKLYRQIIKETGDQIGYTYGRIHNEDYGSQDELNDLMMKISQLAGEKRDAEKNYKELMEKEFADFKEQYDKIYELAASEEGIDQQTLNHVLNVFTQFSEKKININQGVNQGLDYMKKKFELPDDFLTHLPNA